MTKTFEDAMLTVANNSGYTTWSDLATCESKNTIIQCMKEAALLYGEAKWKECGEEMNKDLSRTYKLTIPPFKP